MKYAPSSNNFNQTVYKGLLLVLYRCYGMNAALDSSGKNILVGSERSCSFSFRREIEFFVFVLAPGRESQEPARQDVDLGFELFYQGLYIAAACRAPSNHTFFQLLLGVTFIIHLVLVPSRYRCSEENRSFSIHDTGTS